ncbi:glycoside hydrolase family 6 protein [Candidatus Bathyarchaeota archaeon]|nr:glycoside hydrolase family 6 protein [Candidatus Bathyarchaeota archaeon]
MEAIARLEAAIPDVPCEDVLGVVIYDLPGRDCAAKASNGELAVGEIETYKTEYIDRKCLPAAREQNLEERTEPAC